MLGTTGVGALGIDFGPAISIALTVAQDAFQAYMQFRASGRQDDIADAQTKLLKAQAALVQLQQAQQAQGLSVPSAVSSINQQIAATVGTSSATVTTGEIAIGLGLLLLLILRRR